MSNLIQTIYDKYCNGDHITNFELDVGVSFYREMANNLNLMGPTFKLASTECNKVYLALSSMQQSRSN